MLPHHMSDLALLGWVACTICDYRENEKDQDSSPVGISEDKKGK
jgi:hypothetical protein